MRSVLASQVLYSAEWRWRTGAHVRVCFLEGRRVECAGGLLWWFVCCGYSWRRGLFAVVNERTTDTLRAQSRRRVVVVVVVVEAELGEEQIPSTHSGTATRHEQRRLATATKQKWHSAARPRHRSFRPLDNRLLAATSRRPANHGANSCLSASGVGQSADSGSRSTHVVGCRPRPLRSVISKYHLLMCAAVQLVTTCRVDKYTRDLTCMDEASPGQIVTSLILRRLELESDAGGGERAAVSRRAGIFGPRRRACLFENRQSGHAFRGVG